MKKKCGLLLVTLATLHIVDGYIQTMPNYVQKKSPLSAKSKIANIMMNKVPMATTTTSVWKPKKSFVLFASNLFNDDVTTGNDNESTEEESLSSSEDLDTAEGLITKAKTFLGTDLGISDNSLLDDNFVSIVPDLDQPLGKIDYLAAGKFFNLRRTFPDLDYKSHDFRIDEIDNDTVRFTVRVTGTMRGELRLRNQILPPNGKRMFCPPEAISLKFDKSTGKVIKMTSGFVMDQLVGNTRGLCGVNGAAVVAGDAPSEFDIYPPLQVARRFFGRPVKQIQETTSFLAPFPETVMVQLAKGVLSSSMGSKDPLLLSSDFTFYTPYAGQINKERYLEKYANEEFQNMTPQFTHFRVDPYDPNRVWVDVKPYGQDYEGSPQAMSFRFDDEGFCTRITSAAVMDPSIGNGGGLGGPEGYNYATGNGLPSILTRPLPNVVNRFKKTLLQPVTKVGVDDYSLPGGGTSLETVVKSAPSSSSSTFVPETAQSQPSTTTSSTASPIAKLMGQNAATEVVDEAIAPPPPPPPPQAKQENVAETEEKKSNAAALAKQVAMEQQSKATAPVVKPQSTRKIVIPKAPVTKPPPKAVVKPQPTRMIPRAPTTKPPKTVTKKTTTAAAEKKAAQAEARKSKAKALADEKAFAVQEARKKREEQATARKARAQEAAKKAKASAQEKAATAEEAKQQRQQKVNARKKAVSAAASAKPGASISLFGLDIGVPKQQPKKVTKKPPVTSATTAKKAAAAKAAEQAAASSKAGATISLFGLELGGPPAAKTPPSKESSSTQTKKAASKAAEAAAASAKPGATINLFGLELGGPPAVKFSSPPRPKKSSPSQKIAASKAAEAAAAKAKPGATINLFGLELGGPPAAKTPPPSKKPAPTQTKKTASKAAKAAAKSAKPGATINLFGLGGGAAPKPKPKTPQNKQAAKVKAEQTVKQAKPGATINLFGLGGGAPKAKPKATTTTTTKRVAKAKAVQTAKKAKPGASISLFGFGGGTTVAPNKTQATRKVTKGAKKKVVSKKPTTKVVPKRTLSVKKTATKKTKQAPRGVPTLVRWKRNPDNSITGNISGSKNFRKNERITTSPIATKKIKSGDVVRTKSGSRYFLS